LVVSKRTVETHIGNIFSKLGFSNRAEIVRWAIEAGLAKLTEGENRAQPRV
jgi:DNA-binding NarL/FixJ family response regulator